MKHVVHMTTGNKHLSAAGDTEGDRLLLLRAELDVIEVGKPAPCQSFMCQAAMAHS